MRMGERIGEGFKKRFGNPMKAPKGRNVIAWGIATGLQALLLSQAL
jgi:hypothetical protein